MKMPQAVWLAITLTATVQMASGAPSATRPDSAAAENELGADIRALLSASEIQLARSPKPQASEAMMVNLKAWTVALRFAGTTEDTGSRKQIEELWTTAWKDPTRTAELSAAICHAGAPCSFLTIDVFNRWLVSDDESTLRSMCYWISKFGDEKDVHFLEEKEKLLADPNKQQIVEDALGWRRYWSRPIDPHDPDPGPNGGMPRAGE